MELVLNFIIVFSSKTFKKSLTIIGIYGMMKMQSLSNTVIMEEDLL